MLPAGDGTAQVIESDEEEEGVDDMRPPSSPDDSITSMSRDMRLGLMCDVADRRTDARMKEGVGVCLVLYRPPRR